MLLEIVSALSEALENSLRGVERIIFGLNAKSLRYVEALENSLRGVER